MLEAQEVFRVSTQNVRPDPGALERQLREQRRIANRRRAGAFAIAAVLIGLLAVVAVRAGIDRPHKADAGPVVAGGAGPSMRPSTDAGDPSAGPDASAAPDPFAGSSSFTVLAWTPQEGSDAADLVGRLPRRVRRLLGGAEPVAREGVELSATDARELAEAIEGLPWFTRNSLSDDPTVVAEYWGTVTFGIDIFRQDVPLVFEFRPA